MAVFAFLQVFMKIWNHFLGKQWKAFKTINQKFLLGSIFENYFKAALWGKQEPWVLENNIFCFSTNLWVTKLKPFSGIARQSLFNTKLCHGEHFRKYFWQFQVKVSERLKMTFLACLKVFVWGSRKYFFGKQSKVFCVIHFRKLFPSNYEVKNKFSELLKMSFCHFLTNFWLTKSKIFFKNAKPSLGNYLT